MKTEQNQRVSRYKRPQSVLVLMCAPGGLSLLLERVRPEGLWQSVTGSLRPGESARMAARRELWEETGFGADIPLLDLHQQRRFAIIPPWTERYPPGTGTNLEHWFLACLPSRRMPHLNPAEHRHWQWMPLRRAQEKVFSWTNREALQRYCEPGCCLRRE